VFWTCAHLTTYRNNKVITTQLIAGKQADKPATKASKRASNHGSLQASNRACQQASALVSKAACQHASMPACQLASKQDTSKSQHASVSTKSRPQLTVKNMFQVFDCDSGQIADWTSAVLEQLWKTVCKHLRIPLPQRSCFQSQCGSTNEETL